MENIDLDSAISANSRPSTDSDSSLLGPNVGQELIEDEPGHELLNDSKFRLNAKCMFMTYKTHLKDELIDAINKKYKIKKWMYANESADPNDPYDHTHVLIEFENKIDVKNCKRFDYKGIHPNIGKVRNWARCVSYLMKEGKFLANFKCEKITPIKAVIQKILDAPTVVDAIKDNAKRLNDVLPIIMLHGLRQTVFSPKYIKEVESLVWQPWHDKLVKEFDNNRKRSIIWVYDKIGNTGKTDFCKMFEYANNDRCICITGLGKISDLADFIRNWMEGGYGEPEVVLFDIDRSCEGRDSLYSALENIKRGMLTCLKYKGTMLRYATPVICVFSNWLPELDKLSLDRWRILEIRDPILRDLVRYEDPLLM